MNSAKNGRWIIPFKKFGRLKVKYSKLLQTLAILNGTPKLYTDKKLIC